MQTTHVRLNLPYNSDAELVCTLPRDSVGEAKKLVDEFNDKPHDLIIKLHREKRSLTANAYFHALANKLAAMIWVDNDEMKRELVREYGTIATRDGIPVTITIPKGDKPEDYYPYCEWAGADEFTDTYVLYKQTSGMNTAEFARLIDGTIERCKEVGIETLPPAELERLYAQADAKNGNKTRSQASGI